MFLNIINHKKGGLYDMKPRKRIINLVTALLLLTIIMMASPKNTVQAQENYQWNFCASGSSGWSKWLSMTLMPGQTRTIYFSPMRAGTHYAQFYSSSGTVLVIQPNWTGNTGSGSWGPFYSFYGRITQISLSTGNQSIKYTFKVSELSGKYTVVRYRNYCAP